MFLYLTHVCTAKTKCKIQYQQFWPSNRKKAYPDSGNFEFSFWIWHFSYSGSLEMALKIKVLSPQVFMDLREKIQNSRLKKSTWIFEEHVSVHVFSFLPCLYIFVSGWCGCFVFSEWSYWNNCDNVEWQKDTIKLLMKCLTIIYNLLHAYSCTRGFS